MPLLFLSTAAQAHFGLIDTIVVLLYFAVVAWIGWHFSRQEKTTESYFLGGHHLPAWAIGLSMLATSISSLTFIALPAAAFALDWRFLVPNMVNPFIGILAIWIIIPFFRKSVGVSVFEYLQLRFGSGARLYAAIMFLLSQALRLGSILYLISIPLELITGVSPLICMLVIGGFVALYTIMGGISAVVWTDVIQSFILYFGGFAAMLVMLQGIDGGISGMWSVASAGNKFSLGPMEWNLSERTFWTMLIVGATHWVSGFIADQNVVQRYLAASSLHEARKATAISTVLSLPTWAFFFLLGTTLWVFYKQHANPTVEGMEADAVFPYFILTQMPVGLTGLVIAGILAAAMSSLSSSLNSFATIATIDIVKSYLLKGRSDSYYAAVARWLTGLAAFVMLGIGFIFTRTPKESFQDLSLNIVGLLGGIVLGVFVLGLIAPMVGNRALWQAFAVAFFLNAYLACVGFGWVKNYLPFELHSYWVLPLSNLIFIVLAIILGLIQPKARRTVAGLTVFTSDDSKN
ncbi:MAG: sodium:solute symporter family transporter [Chthoniobacterales bacterium]